MDEVDLQAIDARDELVEPVEPPLTRGPVPLSATGPGTL